MILKRFYQLSKNKDAVLVDFFDTVMFRCIHSHQLMPQWQKALKHKFVAFQQENLDLCKLRKEIIMSLGGNECAISYKTLMKELYLTLEKQIPDLCSFEEFYTVSYKTELYLDLATQYPNKALIRELKKLKNLGKKIYLATDYYLPKECYESYLNYYELNTLFEKIYCSCDYSKTKLNGNLYQVILEDVGVDPKNIIMIGDSNISDVVNAKSYGITGLRYFPVLHKIKTNLRNRCHYNFSKKAYQFIFHKSFNNTLFGEYALNLYFFTKELHQHLMNDGAEKVGFLSRGGYFLKRCFDYYEELYINDEQFIKSVYIKNSRKVNRLAQNNIEDSKLLHEYIDAFAENGKLYLVDEGWYCSSQITMSETLGYQTYGYYLGVMGKKKTQNTCIRKGLLFDIDEEGNKSSLFGVFRTNCTFYEQLLSAPHGSVISYRKDRNKVSAIEKWQNIEKELYFNYVEHMQEIILDNMAGLTVWDTSISKYNLAKCVLKTLLFGNKKRIDLLNKFNNSWFDNAIGTTKASVGDIKSVHISLIELVKKPEEYLRYFCKLKELTVHNRKMRFIYHILGPCIYIYCRISIWIKYKID